MLLFLVGFLLLSLALLSERAAAQGTLIDSRLVMRYSARERARAGAGARASESERQTERKRDQKQREE